jgi:hypothetical protein
MTLSKLHEPPHDIGDNLRPYSSSEGLLESWLQVSLSRAAHNVHVPECALATVFQVHSLAQEHHYTVQLLPIAGKTAQVELSGDYIGQVPRLLGRFLFEEYSFRSRLEDRTEV